jgi:hypothetical protein
MNIGQILALLAAVGLIASRFWGRASIKIEDPKFWVRVALSVVLLGGSLFVILSENYGDDVNKWAFGVIGTVTGYWFGQEG